MGSEIEATEEKIQALFDAADSGDCHGLRDLVGQGVPVDSTHDDGQTALMCAATVGSPEVVGCLLELGARPDLSDRYGETVLMRAASSGNVEAVRLLLQASADVGRVDSGGNTAMAYAKRSGHTEIMKLLLAAGAQPVITKTVLVLGAGFTRAFLPSAPLLVGSYSVKEVLAIKYAKFKPVVFGTSGNRFSPVSLTLGNIYVTIQYG